jgi:hypothetical protein
VLPALRRSRNMLAHPGPAANEVAQFVVASAIACRRRGAFQSQHRSTSAFDAAMVLLKSVVEIATRPMSHLPAEPGLDRSGISVMAVCRDPVRRDAGHRLGRSKECLGGSQVAVLAQHDIDQGAVTIDRPIQIPPLAAHSDVRFIDIPAATDPAFALAPEVLRQSRCQLRLPLPPPRR